MQFRKVASAVAGTLTLDLIAAAGVGLNYRIDRHWIAGVQVGAVHAFPLDAPALDSFEGLVHVSRYFYPR